MTQASDTPATVETREFDAFARRILRAYAKRVVAGDIEALPSLCGLATAIDQAMQDAVDGLRAFRVLLGRGRATARRQQAGRSDALGRQGKRSTLRVLDLR